VDLLILPEATLPVGSIVHVRILGILEAEQYKSNKKPRRNDRVIARLVESRLFAKVQHIDQLGKTFVEELSTFFSTYKRLRGQTYTVTDVGGPDRAADLILEGADEYLQQLEQA
jgi:inorganic pyrophosphatase